MPRITHGTSTSASTSGPSSTAAISSAARFRLTVRTPSGGWWTFSNQDAKAEWQADDSALYQVKDAYVLHDYPPNARHDVRRRKVLADGSTAVDIDLAGTSRQIDPYHAAEWLIEHREDLPAELRPFEKDVLASRERVPDVSTTDENAERDGGSSGAGTTTDPLLGERAQLVLTVLRNDKAFDSDHRMRTADIAVKAAGRTADPNQYKEVITELKALEYVDTKEGRGGGCWLTAAGRRRAEKL